MPEPSSPLVKRFLELSVTQQRHALAFAQQIALLARYGGTGTIHAEYNRGFLKGLSTMHKQQFNDEDA